MYDIAGPEPASIASKPPGPGPSRPFPGLRPYRPEEWSIFCGREETVREVLYRLGEHNVVLVHGGSGCGKSSLILAGVLPGLEREMSLVNSTLAHATIRPSQGPLGALAATLAYNLGAPPGTDENDPCGAWTSELLFASNIVERIEQAIAAKPLDLFCLVVDQFEEIFAWARTRRPSDVGALIKLLDALAQPGKGRRLVVIVTMRSDFLSQCAQFPDLAPVINTCQFYIPNLDERGLERAMLEPAAMYGGSIDGALVARLKAEASGAIDALPVLQHAMMRMVEPKIKRGDKAWRLTLDDYRLVTTDLGGDTPPDFVGSALSVHAEEIRSELGAAQQVEMAQAVETVFRALLEVDAAGRVVRRPTELATLEAMASDDARPHISTVIEAYTREGNNLLVQNQVQQTGEKIVDISHEALLRNWWRMSSGPKGLGPGWIRREADDALTWRTLALTAQDGDAKLDASTLARMRVAYAQFASAPERVRRYMLRGEGKTRVSDEREWVEVAALFTRSERRQRQLGALRLASIFLVAAGLAIAIVPKLLDLLSAARSTIANADEINSGARDAADSQAAQNIRLSKQNDALKAQNEVLAQSAAVVLKELQTQPAKDTLNNAKKALIEQVARGQPINAVATGGGYIWIGDGGPTGLKTKGGAVSVSGASAIRAGTPYILARNTALRATLPDAANRSQRIGALQAGTEVAALEAAERAGNGQYWLRVGPVQGATVYVQYATGNPTSLLQRLVASGFNVPPAEQLAIAEGLNEVRYCRKSDSAAAGRVATAIAPQRGAPLPTRWIGANGACMRISTPGTVEVWIGRAGED